MLQTEAINLKRRKTEKEEEEMFNTIEYLPHYTTSSFCQSWS
jgi:hypothetical protein